MAKQKGEPEVLVDVGTKLPISLAKRLRVVAAQHGVKQQDLFRDAITPVIEKLEKEAR